MKPANGVRCSEFWHGAPRSCLVPTGHGETPAATQPGLHHTAWQLESFEALQDAYRELGQLGIAVEATTEHNVTRSVYFHDPDGNRVELYCDMGAEWF